MFSCPVPKAMLVHNPFRTSHRSLDSNKFTLRPGQNQTLEPHMCLASGLHHEATAPAQGFVLMR